jgi:alpha/beta superfamily hydrolase
MITFTEHQLALLKHYAQVTNQNAAYRMIEEGNITSEADAITVKRFADMAFDQSSSDEKAKRIVCGEHAYHGDLIKLCMFIEDFVEEKGYGYIYNDEQ